jgi:hypothetical protein
MNTKRPPEEFCDDFWEFAAFCRACCKTNWRFATGPEFCPPKGFQNTSLVCWQLKTEVLQLPT